MASPSSFDPVKLGIGKRVPVALLALLIGLVAAVYWNGLGGGYVFDDFHNIVENPNLRVAGSAWQDWINATLSTEAGPFQRPLAMLSFAVNVHFTGLDPWPMKLTNLIVHLFNTLLVYAVCRQIFQTSTVVWDRSTTRGEWAALFVASCWALHPINLMAVLYVVQRMESLSHTFVFAGLFCYLIGRRRLLQGGKGWLLIVGGIVGGTILGALSKESAVLLPLYAFGLEVCLFHFRTKPGQGPDVKLGLFFLVFLLIPAVLAVGLLLPAMLAPGAYAIRTFTMSERLLTESRVVFDYLHWTVLPNLNQLGIYHDDYQISRGLMSPPTTLLALIALPAIMLAAWRIRSFRPVCTLGVFWFFSAHLLTATFIPLELVYEHRNYFASLGICLIVADIAIFAPRSEALQRAGILICAVVVILLAGLTFLRANEWSHPLRFALTEVAKHPNSPRATYEVARNLVGLTYYDSASPFLTDAWPALQHARDVPGSNILPNQAALILASRIGVPQDRIWWEDMQAKLRTQTMGAANISGLIALNDCAVEGICFFEPDDMLATFTAALQRNPEAGVLSIYGKYALHVLKDPDLALRLWEEAVLTGANNPIFHTNLAMLQIDLGKFDEARLEIARLRASSRLGVYESTALQLEQRLRSAQAEREKTQNSHAESPSKQ